MNASAAGIFLVFLAARPIFDLPFPSTCGFRLAVGERNFAREPDIARLSRKPAAFHQKVLAELFGDGSFFLFSLIPSL
jgi:hypothetical protein